MSVEITADISVDFWVNMATETSRSIYRPSVGRHVDRHIDRASTDTRPIYRPIYRSRGAQNTHDPIQLGRFPTCPVTVSEGKYLSTDCLINKRDFAIFCYDFENDNEAIGNTFSSYVDMVLLGLKKL